MSGWRFNPVALLRGFLRPIDPMLLLLLGVLLGYAWVLMQSASPERLDNQLLHFGIALGAMWCMAWLKPTHMLSLALPLYAVGVVLLLGVEFFGEVSKGAQRWLDIGITRIQPSEIMKIAMPLMLAWYFQQREGQTRFVDFLVAGLLLVVPFGLILIQPDLGTSLLVAASGLYVIYFAGLSWKLIVPLVLAAVIGIGSIVAFGDTLCQPEVDWQVLREYQKQRVCTLLDPTRDPLGKGFHIIQSTIAIGSGGVSGKGWMEGTADAPCLPARAPYRLHLRGARRGVRSGRRGRAAGDLPAAAHPRLHHRRVRAHARLAPAGRRGDDDLLHLCLHGTWAWSAASCPSWACRCPSSATGELRSSPCVWASVS